MRRGLVEPNLDEDERPAAERVRDALVKTSRDGVVRMPRAAWIVTARA